MTNHFSDFTYKYSDKFSEVCKPIFENSPITFCSFGRIFYDGSYTGFMSDPVWTNYYLEKHYTPTLNHWVLNIIKTAEVGYCIWSMSNLFNTNRATKNLLEDCNLFRYNNGIIIIDAYDHYYEATTFCSPKIYGIEKIFIENKDILRKYISYIKEKMLLDSYLAAELKTRYSLPFDLCPNIKNNFPKPKVQLIEFNNINISSGNKKNELIKISKQQAGCISFLLTGATAKETAQHMGLSFRTIEEYIKILKRKFNARNKADLIVKLSERKDRN